MGTELPRLNVGGVVCDHGRLNPAASADIGNATTALAPSEMYPGVMSPTEIDGEAIASLHCLARDKSTSHGENGGRG